MLNGAEDEEAPKASVVVTVKVAGVNAAVAAVGGEVITKSSVVGLTYWKTPLRPLAGVPPATVPVVVTEKPVPVKAMTVPTGALTARAEGAAEVMAGPATLKALGKYVPSMSAEWAPVTAPELTANSHVSVVPLDPPRHEAAVVPIVALASDVVDVPGVVSTGVVYWLKPVPVKVIVC
jgi:hypothetical protein